MHNSTPIQILEKESNRRGDLFGRLMADLFVALGYQVPRLNIHKSGRELDLEAEHRLEPRRAVAECKATAKPIGGDDVNKFVGALDAERGAKDKKPVTGYFVSLSGFKETAIEQERQGRRTRIVTLTGPQIVDELVKGRLLVTRERATELAGRCCSGFPELELDPDTALLAHERGWIWAVYYLSGKHRTHFVLIHADGTLLASALSEEVIAADRGCGGDLNELICLNPVPPDRDDPKRVQEAQVAYFQYLANECGTIQLDGLPADSEVGSRRLRLENLFVPLHLDVQVRRGEELKVLERQTVGAVLAEHPRLALLAAPGGGKSTLVKRLATAYTDPSRREEIGDDLPDRDWLPLFFRCRELRGLARASFAELVEALSKRDPVRLHEAVFRAEVDRALLAGRVLLLVDGLDEISDPGDRAAFVCTLRSTLQAYPGIAIVVTSREAGFRHVAAHLTTDCTQATLSPFDTDDIRRLTVAWHKEVVGDSEQVRTDAEELAASISSNDRIFRLAVNPLLLTTLLLVKRWVGTLPTRRAVLYGKAVEVLLMTWNVEGHEPLREEEAIPQLCYVASAMMLDGIQKVSRPHLARILQEARDALPTELGFVEGTVEEFIHRVEDRSSLLMMTGRDVEDGRLVEFFEFRHLTFQEFLTARSTVEGWHPGRKNEDTLVSVLDPHVNDEKWREVIPLAAVLGGKQTDQLIQHLTERTKRSDSEGEMMFRDGSLAALGNCLADEAAAPPPTIRRAIQALVGRGERLHRPHVDFVKPIVRGRYGEAFFKEAGRAFFESDLALSSAGNALALAAWYRVPMIDDAGKHEVIGRFLTLLESSEVSSRCEGALGFMLLCYVVAVDVNMFNERLVVGSSDEGEFSSALKRGGDLLQPMLFSSCIQEQWASCWALAWLGSIGAWRVPASPDVLGRLFELWRTAGDESLRTRAGWALRAQPLTSRDAPGRFSSVDRTKVTVLMEGYSEMSSETERLTALVSAWYLQAMDDRQLSLLVDEVSERELSKAEISILHDLRKHLKNSEGARH